MINVNSIVTGCIAASGLFAQAVYGLGAADGAGRPIRTENVPTDEHTDDGTSANEVDFGPMWRYGKMMVEDPSGSAGEYYVSASDDDNVDDVRDGVSTYAFAAESADSSVDFIFHWYPHKRAYLVQAVHNNDNNIGTDWFLAAVDEKADDKYYGTHVAAMLIKDRNRAALWAPEEVYGKTRLKLVKNFDAASTYTEGQYLWAASFIERYNKSYYLALIDGGRSAAYVNVV